MYREARAETLYFYKSPSGVRNAATAGRLTRLVPNGDFALHEVGYPYVLPMTKTFVTRLAPQYRATCGEQMTVTSAVRPTSRQPPNSVAQSVHPTGMAVDLRKPTASKCLRWLRSTLLELEETGVLETTEEFSPPHFHVAVYPAPYNRYVAARTVLAAGTELASAGSAAATYRVRPGDTLWDIARAHDVTVEALSNVNRLEDDLLQPGQELVIPAPDER